MKPLPLPQLLQRNRVMVVCSASFAYLLYAALTALVDPPREGWAALANPKNIAAAVALLTAAATLWQPRHVQGIYAVTSCLLRPKPGSIRPSLRGQAGIRANLLDQCALELIR